MTARLFRRNVPNQFKRNVSRADELPCPCWFESLRIPGTSGSGQFPLP